MSNIARLYLRYTSKVVLLCDLVNLWFERLFVNKYVCYVLLGILSGLPFINLLRRDQGLVDNFDYVLFLFAFGVYCRGILRTKRKKVRAYLAFTYWCSYYVVTLYWLAYPLTIDMRTHGILIPFALVTIPSCLAMLFMIPAYLIKSSSIALVLSNFAVLWFWGHYAPGFPWALPGYVWFGSLSMQQWLSVWGIYGQTLVTLILGGLFGMILDKNKREWFCLGFAILIGMTVCGSLRLRNGPREFTDCKVRCVQGNILQERKMDLSLSTANLGLQLRLSYQDIDKFKPDLVIWPEASIPYLFVDHSPSLSRQLGGVVPEGSYFISGVVRKDSIKKATYNSVVVIDKEGRNIAYYDKKRLVPFGEYIPFRNFIPQSFAPIANSIGDFDIGERSNIIKLKGLNVAFMVCYEAIFPGDFVFGDVDVIVNITNDAWFYGTDEPFQHLNMVRARAIEEGVPLIRVTNYGFSAMFDAYGRKVDMLNLNQEGVIDCKIPKKIENTWYRSVFANKWLGREENR